MPPTTFRRPSRRSVLRGGAAELYHVGRDPGETDDLAGRHPAKLRQLTTQAPTHLLFLSDTAPRARTPSRWCWTLGPAPSR